MQLKYGRFCSAAIHGIEGILIEIEVSLLPGLPSFEIVGQGDSAIRESRNRILAAIKNSGFAFPPSRVTASLAPAWMRKEGSAFDLPLALSILLASGQVHLHPSFNGQLPGAFGELGLDGTIRPIPGVFNRTAAIRQASLRHLLVPADNVAEARTSASSDLKVAGTVSLSDSARILAQGMPEDLDDPLPLPVRPVTAAQAPDIRMIQGQAKAVRALILAAAGWHPLLLLGSPGSGKTALASTLPGILPPLGPDEAQLVTKIHSAASRMVGQPGLLSERPFLAPHAGVTRHALTGGGNPPVPGLFSLSHLGVLFLDELTQLDSSVIDMLRQPLEEREIHLSRLRYNLVLPADFLLVAAANPCRCGEYFEPGQRCHCTPDAVARHLGKISGPLLDRLDLAVEVRRPASDDLIRTVQPQSGSQHTLSSSEVRQKIAAAWQVQLDRCRALGRAPVLNGRFEDPDLARLLAITPAVLRLSVQAAERYHLSVRSYQKLLRVTRTIADLEGTEEVTTSHLAEALGYRINLFPEGQL
ncbi:MAG: YifB family Mg chelatase-like AAA ATPase [Eubacteriales bacterium]|nr:YifB family Mg chelatase-like AAA ATPase [Eubacteriales bacterium]